MRVFAARGGEEARAIARRSRLDVALVDLHLSGESGIDVVRWLRGKQPALGITLVTGSLTPDIALEVAHAGADDVMAKPFALPELMTQLDRRRAARLENGDFRSLAKAEWDQIQRVLAACRGNKSKAARSLGISRSTLRAKLGEEPPSG